jgi:hypothetical protein
MMGAKYKVGDEVTVSRVRGPHKIEAVKEQYYIRDEGWFNACALTPYVRPLQVGDRVKADSGMMGVVCYVHANEACFIADDDKELWIDDLDNLQRIPEEAA